MIKSILNEEFMTDQSMGASFSSAPIRLTRAKEFNIQLLFSGTPIGAFKLQFSTDKANTPSEVVNWDDIPDSSQSISAAGSHAWIVKGRYKWVRFIYTRTSGTGSCSGTIFAAEEF